MNFGNTGNGLGGLHDFMKDEFANKNQSNMMQCETLQSRIEAAGITHIDYLSLDIEGAEFEALKGVDWSSTRVDVLTIEHPENKEGFEQYLETLGFEEKIWINGVDKVYVHQDATDKIQWIDQWMSKTSWMEKIPCEPYTCSTSP